MPHPMLSSSFPKPGFRNPSFPLPMLINISAAESWCCRRFRCQLKPAFPLPGLHCPILRCRGVGVADIPVRSCSRRCCRCLLLPIVAVPRSSPRRVLDMGPGSRALLGPHTASGVPGNQDTQQLLPRGSTAKPPSSSTVITHHRTHPVPTTAHRTPRSLRSLVNSAQTDSEHRRPATGPPPMLDVRSLPARPHILRPAALVGSRPLSACRRRVQPTPDTVPAAAAIAAAAGPLHAEDPAQPFVQINENEAAAIPSSAAVSRATAAASHRGPARTVDRAELASGGGTMKFITPSHSSSWPPRASHHDGGTAADPRRRASVGYSGRDRSTTQAPWQTTVCRNRGIVGVSSKSCRQPRQPGSGKPRIVAVV